MQKSIWPLAFLHYLHWFGSLVNGAAVLTSPSSILQPQPLNQSNAIIPGGLSIVFKERGPELPAVKLFQAGLVVIAHHLGPEDYSGFITTRAWSLSSIILGVSADQHQRGKVQRRFVILGIYFLFLLMKNANDFRSGVFEIRYVNISVCDLVIFPAGSSGLKNQPSFAHMTQLATPPLSIVNNTNSSPEVVASALGNPHMTIKITQIKPFRPLDQLGMMIGLVDMVVAAAKFPKDERVQTNTESTVPFSGVKTSIIPSVDVRPPYALTYENVLHVATGISHSVTYGDTRALAATRAQLYLDSVYSGEITLEPSNSSTPTSPLIEANAEASADTATAKEKRSMTQRLWDAGRS